METGKSSVIPIANRKLRTFSYNTIIVGSGAAGLNAAGQLHRLGQKDIAIVTEGILMGTSRNTGSDKQTYYRMALSGDESDSIIQMAHNLFDGGAMDGDIALCEAASSTRAFFHLVELGVPFPHDRYGEYIGYKTDHDPCKRGTSVGPLTSKYMSECLLRDVQERQIPIFDGFQVIEILTTPCGKDSRSIGVLALDLHHLEDDNRRYVAFISDNIIYATGGEAGMYQLSVYPGSQTGGTGTALRAGVCGKNLTESQYGIASIKFRWNLSGSYQQVLPRYLSTREDGSDAREFLDEYFESPEQLLTAIFLKGYQWPFDPRKLENSGSSLIDFLVYYETIRKHRHVFLDFTHNPSCIEQEGKVDFSRLGKEAFEYLANCRALLNTPFERLNHMNRPAVELYRDHHIDLSTEPLEIAVCAQHNNGGLAGNIWWESNITHFFPVGEVNGTHGVYRPGGSALNAGQVGSLRASQYIVQNYTDAPMDTQNFLKLAGSQLEEAIQLGENWLNRKPLAGKGTAHDRITLGKRMSQYGAQIRSLDGVRLGRKEAESQMNTIVQTVGIQTPGELPQMYRNRDLLVSQIAYFFAIEDYIGQGGESRGSYLILRHDGKRVSVLLPAEFSYKLAGKKLAERVQEVTYRQGKCHVAWRDVRPFPELNTWFETVWNDYRNNQVIN